MNDQLMRALFEDLARCEEQAESASREAMTSPTIPVWVDSEEAVRVLRATLSTPEQVEALAIFVRERVHACLHSVLVSIDGGSASAEIGELNLVDNQGDPLGDALHEHYIDYLLETGRMAE